LGITAERRGRFVLASGSVARTGRLGGATDSATGPRVDRATRACGGTEDMVDARRLSSGARDWHGFEFWDPPRCGGARSFDASAVSGPRRAFR
jgi:hypothetical protein